MEMCLKRGNAVLIPVYKLEFSPNELISLSQALRVFSAQRIIFMCPERFQATDVPNLIQVKCKLRHTDSAVILLPDRYFESVMSYNNLMLSIEFYERLAEYDNILIYQTDAFAFCDKLDAAASLGYDYIGAPWLINNKNEKSELRRYAGNGGFSLRKIDSFMNVLNSPNRRVVSISDFACQAMEFIKTKQCKPLRIAFSDLIWNSDLSSMGRSRSYFEDIFWAKFASRIRSDFLVAPPSVALKFSFECQPRRMYSMNDFQLPFGCHAWWKYDFQFWRPYIEACGYQFESK